MTQSAECLPSIHDAECSIPSIAYKPDVVPGACSQAMGEVEKDLKLKVISSYVEVPC